MKFSKYIIWPIILLIWMTLLPVRAQDQAQDAYQEAYNYILDENWNKAIKALDKFIKQNPGSNWADDAHFWQCYARGKTGKDLETVFECYQQFIESWPKSRWVDDAKSHMIRIGEELVGSGKTEYKTIIESLKEDDDEEIAMSALMALQQMGSDEAIPIVLKLYANTKNKEVKDKVIYFLSRSDAPEAREKLITIAQKEEDSKLRGQAIFWMGQNARSDKTLNLLKDIALNDENPDIRKKAIFALGQAPGGRGLDFLMEIAKSYKDPGMRGEAIFWVGQKAKSEKALEWLKDVALNDENPEMRKKAIFALGQAPGGRGLDFLMEIAKSYKDPEMRGEAIFWVGQKAKSGKALEWLKDVALNDENPEVRKKAIFALSQVKDSGNVVDTLKSILKNAGELELKEQALFALSQLKRNIGIPILIDAAKNDTNPELRKKAIFWLGQSRDPRAEQALLEIISGE